MGVLVLQIIEHILFYTVYMFYILSMYVRILITLWGLSESTRGALICFKCAPPLPDCAAGHDQQRSLVFSLPLFELLICKMLFFRGECSVCMLLFWGMFSVSDSFLFTTCSSLLKFHLNHPSCPITSITLPVLSVQTPSCPITSITFMSYL